MEKLRSRLAAGARVRVRGSTWRIRQVQRFESCALVSMAGIGADNAGEHRTLIDPFDCLQFEDEARPFRAVRRKRWGRALKRALAMQHPHDGLKAALRSSAELLPFQLEPALAAVRGLACRFLLADEVGLGKTIQAGRLLVELRERGRAERVLILTPAGLRRQWQAELAQHFSIGTTIVDSPLLSRRASSLPAAVNPWLLDRVAIASIDLIKRPSAMRGLGSMVWDLLIVDEAHLAAQAEQRHAGVNALACQARCVVLITATPHAGDANAFASLCRLGRVAGEPLAMFRRSRAQVGLMARRRVRTLPVRLTPEEAHLHQLLRRYAAAVVHDARGRRRETLLAITVLMKRALSSPLSLGISIDRRLQLLAHEPEVESQLPLPLPLIDDETDDRDLVPNGVLRVPGLADRSQELASLREIGAAARAVAPGRKLRVLARLIARVREPVLIFTEYRDTLEQVARAIGDTTRLAVIHGGLTEAERIEAQTAFTQGRARILLATDAAGEGLNLHARCRFVVNLELPWNPMRLEQRIGRVDRLGQSRVVHVLNMFARGTVESDVLARLVRRLARAQRDVGQVNDPLGSLDPDDLTSLLFASEGESQGVSNQDVEAELWEPRLREEAVAECSRLESLRQAGAGAERAAAETHALVTTVSSRRLSSAVTSPALLFLVRADLVDGAGRSIEQAIIPVIGPVPADSPRHCPLAVRAIVEQTIEGVRPLLLSRAAAAVRDRLQLVRRPYRAALDAARSRELALIDAITSKAKAEAGALFQAGLFDRRAARERDDDRSDHGRQMKQLAARLAQIELARSSVIITNLEPILALLVGNRG